MTIMNPRNEYWLSRVSNQRLPVLTSCALPIELWGSAYYNYIFVIFLVRMKILSYQSTNVRFLFHRTESSQLNKKNNSLKHTQSTCRYATFWNFCVGWRHDVNICTVLRPMTSWNLISHLCETRKLVMAILQTKKKAFICDKNLYQKDKQIFVYWTFFGVPGCAGFWPELYRKSAYCDHSDRNKLHHA